MAEMVDARDLKSSAFGVQVRILLRTPLMEGEMIWAFLSLYFMSASSAAVQDGNYRAGLSLRILSFLTFIPAVLVLHAI